MKEFAGKKITGIITAGGLGSRMHPITDFMPKELLMYGNKPFIAYCLEAFSKCGIRKVKIVVGHKKGLILDYVKDGSDWELEVEYVFQKKAVGLGDAVKLAIDKDESADEFVLMLGDNVVEPYTEIKKMVNEHVSSNSIATVLISEAGDADRYGVVKVDTQGVIMDALEKPKIEQEQSEYRLSNGKFNVISGVYAFNRDFLGYLRELKPGINGEYQLTDALKGALPTKRVTTHKLNGSRIDVGTPIDYILEQKKLFARKGADELTKEWGV